MALWQLTGGHDGGYFATLATILKFDPASLSWRQVGEMVQARYLHGASVVRAEEVEQFCVET